MIELHLNIFQNVVENPASSIPIPRKTGWSELFCEHHKWEKKKTAKDNHCQKPKYYEENTTTNSSSSNNNNKCKQKLENQEKEDDQELHQVCSYCKPRPKTSERHGTLKCVASASCFSQF
jgi:hypothetical protein